MNNKPEALSGAEKAIFKSKKWYSLTDNRVTQFT